MGPADYLTLASNYRTVIITSIPVFKLSAKDQARRFISLIDALYEARCQIICLAESDLEDLFFPEQLTAGDRSPNPDEAEPPFTHVVLDTMMAESVSETQDMYRPNTAAYDTPRMETAPIAPEKPLALDTLSIFSGEMLHSKLWIISLCPPTGKEEQFAYKRALSRLIEMTSATYLCEESWTPLPLASRKWEGASKLSGPSTLQNSVPKVELVDKEENSESATETVTVYTNVKPLKVVQYHHDLVRTTSGV